MQKIKKTPTQQEAYTKLSARCALAEISPQDAIHKMSTWGMADQEISVVMKQLMKEDFINEKRYAQAFTHDKFEFSGWGRQKIAISLKQKGISNTLIQEALKEIPPATYNHLLFQLLSEKARNVQAKSSYEMRGKLLRFGLSRGFEQDLIFKMLDKLPNTQDFDETLS
ncbi:MAG: regulatory protein RecX [Bacteroidaceae bacterium]|jgi:regulatory protein|nr:regulatory protein RecX [Bacteroidaceae bacterium]